MIDSVEQKAEALDTGLDLWRVFTALLRAPVINHALILHCYCGHPHGSIIGREEQRSGEDGRNGDRGIEKSFSKGIGEYEKNKKGERDRERERERERDRDRDRDRGREKGSEGIKNRASDREQF